MSGFNRFGRRHIPLPGFVPRKLTIETVGATRLTVRSQVLRRSGDLRSSRRRHLDANPPVQASIHARERNSRRRSLRLPLRLRIILPDRHSRAHSGHRRVPPLAAAAHGDCACAVRSAGRLGGVDQGCEAGQGSVSGGECRGGREARRGGGRAGVMRLGGPSKTRID